MSLHLSGAAVTAQPSELIINPPSFPVGLFARDRSPRVLAVQILLDRGHHSPGVIDGLMGQNTRRAILSYQRRSGLDPTGTITPGLISHLRQAHGTKLWQRYTITADDVDGPFRNVPASMGGKAQLDRTAFGSPAEMLAERFHLSRAFLNALNPGVDFGQVGAEILVPWVGNDGLTSAVARIEVDKSTNELRAFAANGSWIASYPVTVGSNIYPSPSDQLKVLAVAPNPTYYFDPSGRSWGPNRELVIAPGPNNPVGTVWIDLSRDGFGIHGTPEPRLIGKTESHGCVRLTNWDAEELANAVGKGTIVAFV